jgi:hypothetical protein
MASQQVVGFVSLDDLSLELAASLLRSGYAVQAFEVSSSILLPGKNVKRIRNLISLVSFLNT